MQAVEPKVLRISYSAATQFEKCPARFKAERLDGIRGPRPEHLEVGVFLHEVTEHYLKHLQRSNQAVDFPYAAKLFDDMWADRPTVIPEASYEELRELWKDIYEHLVMRDIAEVVEPELKLAFDTSWKRVDWHAPTAWVRLKIDMLKIGGSWQARIWDLKTGRKIESAEESKQLKMYGAAVLHAFPKVQSVVGELYYPRFGITKSYELQQGDVDEGQRWITGVSNRIQAAAAADRWPATPGPGCQDCPVFASCGARKRVVAPVATNMGEAETLAAQLVLLGRQFDELNDALKAFVEANGPVEFNGMIADFGLVQRLSWPTDKLLPILKQHAVPSEKVLKADSKKLERFASKNDALRAALQQIVVDRSSTKFQIKMAGTEPTEAA